LITSLSKKDGRSDAKRGWQEGERKGTRNVIEFLEQGHSLEEAKKEFALT